MKRETKNKTRDDTDDGESYSSYSSGEEDIRSSKPSVEQAFTQVLLYASTQVEPSFEQAFSRTGLH